MGSQNKDRDIKWTYNPEETTAGAEKRVSLKRFRTGRKEGRKLFKKLHNIQCISHSDMVVTTVREFCQLSCCNTGSDKADKLNNSFKKPNSF